jgi:hypothetical protein
MPHVQASKIPIVTTTLNQKTRALFEANAR